MRQHAYPCRKKTPAQPAYPYIFPSALRAAGESMEAALRSRAKHSGTVNLLSKLRSSSLFGTGRSRAAVPRPWLEGRHRRRLRLAMGGCFAFIVAYEGIRRHRMACHANASRSLPRSHRLAAQLGQHAHESHDGPEERSICDRSRGAIRLFVLLCLCPSRAVPVGVEGIKIIII